MLDFEHVSRFREPVRRRSYSIADTQIYALGISPDLDPLVASDLALVFEGNGPRVYPTMAAAFAGTLTRHLRLDMTKVVHGSQRVLCQKELPPSGELELDGRVVEVVDKGRDALITFEILGTLAGEGTPLFTATSTLFVRGAGGFGGSSETRFARHDLPVRKADVVHRIPGRPDQALIYRLSGDLNPLHVDPVFAGRAGFPKPILHGLCTYGMACRAIANTVLDGDPRAIASFDARFAAPVFPGELLTVEIWRDGPVVSFRCSVEERQVVVLDNGRCILREGI